MAERRFGTIIVGGGPAGLAPLVSASRDGRLAELLAGGVAIVEQGGAIGNGRIGHYAISSDSTAETFLTAVTGHTDPRLGVLLDSPLCRDLQTRGRGAVPLGMAGALMAEIGAILAGAVADAGGAVLTHHEALGATQQRDGSWSVRVRRLYDGAEIDIAGDALILATGGDQAREQLRHEPVAGQPLLPRYDDKLILSDEALRESGVAQIRSRLEGIADPKIAIVGGSTSALAAAGLLLRRLPERTTRPGSITVLHRRPLRVFYPSAEAALADGYTEFGAADLCPLSGFVFRLAGFRLDSRDLLMGIRQIGGRPAEPRVVLHRIVDADPDATHRLLADADVVVAALGYRPRALPLRDRHGHELPLMGRVRKAPLVDEICRIRDLQDQPIRNLFGIGLAAGFVPRGKLGGEPSFTGQANGLWLWQTAVGAMIVDGVLAARRGPEPVEVPAADLAVAVSA